MDESTLREIVTRQAAGERFAVCLLAHVQGSAPQKAGARLIVLPQGTMIGTVGGGCLEMETRRRALDSLETGTSDLFELRLDDDFGWDDGLICGGRTTMLVSPHPERVASAFAEALALREAGQRSLLVTVLVAPDPESVGLTVCLPPDGGAIPRCPVTVVPPPGTRPAVLEQDGWRLVVEPVRPSPRLIVMGCGHIGAAVVELAASVGFDVVAVDDRIDYASVERLPWAQQVICDDMCAMAETLSTGPDTYWVIVTRGHRNDGRVLTNVVNRDWAYLGMIGSRRKVRIIREGLLAENVTTPQRIALLHAPVGIDIGAESPREIALSITAELVAARHGKLSAKS